MRRIQNVTSLEKDPTLLFWRIWPLSPVRFARSWWTVKWRVRFHINVTTSEVALTLTRLPDTHLPHALASDWSRVPDALPDLLDSANGCACFFGAFFSLSLSLFSAPSVPQPQSQTHSLLLCCSQSVK